jgi:hypothetical protein
VREQKLLEDGDLVERSLGVFEKPLGEQLRLLEPPAEIHRLDPPHPEFVPRPRIGSGDDQIKPETKKTQGGVVSVGFSRPLTCPQVHFGELLSPVDGHNRRRLIE